MYTIYHFTNLSDTIMLCLVHWVAHFGETKWNSVFVKPLFLCVERSLNFCSFMCGILGNTSFKKECFLSGIAQITTLSPLST